MKKLISCLLALAMVLTSLSLPVNSVAVEAAEKSTSEQASNGVTDVVGVQVDQEEQLQVMQLYLNGVYETALTLEAGDHVLKITNSGSDIGEVKVTVSEKQSVYVRLQDGKIYDSINNADQFQYASIVGNFTGINFLDQDGNRYDIAAWAPADKNALMEYLGGGLYKKRVKFEALASDVTLADGGYKIAFNGTWDKTIGDADGNNIPLTIPAKTEAMTFFIDAINGVAYDSIQSNAYTVTQNSGAITYPAFNMTVSLIGTVRGDDSVNWDAAKTGYEFTQITDKLFLYQTEMKKGSYQYKTVFNYDKWYEKADNQSLEVAEDGTHVVFLYDASDESIYDSVSNSAAIADKLGMKTEPATSSITTNANGTTKFVTTAGTNEKDDVELVYANKSTPKDTKKVALLKGTNGSGKFNGTFVSSDLFFGDAAVDLVYYYEVNGSKVLDSSATTVKVDGEEYSSYTRAKFTGRLVNVPGTFSNPSWDATSNPMNYDGDGRYSYTFKGIIAGNYEFKISMGSWDENYGQEGKAGGANYKVTVPEKQDVTVYYNDITTHYAVTSVDYILADISLEGTGIPKDTKFTDPGFAGIYTTTVSLKAGDYKDVTVKYNGTSYPMDEFTLDKDKDVTFYFDPTTDIYYNDSNEVSIDASKVYFDSKDATYKSVFGAAEEGEKVTYKIKTGTDATKVKLIVKGTKNTTVDFTKEVKDEDTYWSGDLTMESYGQYKYFFVVYYGSSVKIYCDDDGNYGAGHLTDLTSLRPYDLTVYKKGYTTPDWMKNGVVYQIFPDRFYNGDTSNDDAQTTARGAQKYEFITNWSTLPENPEQESLNPSTYPSNAYKGDGDFSNEIYGGDLQGIIKRMDYLKAVGVNVIYLNPIFSSISAHRYDTTDYTKIDPVLGTLGDFSELVQAAKDNDMHIVLDGVFNHVCDDSVYFDRYYKFVGKDGKVGAYPYWAYVYDYMSEHNASQSVAETKAKEYFKTRGVTDFSYTEWFEVTTDSLKDDYGEVVKDTIGERKGKDVYGYEGWWGYASMPVIMSTNGSEYQTGNWGETVIEGENSIGQYWLKQGSNGWRLDVANEVSDETWQHFRDSVKALNSDNVVIGEIWTDATKYVLGDMYDSVMNYVFRDATLAYAKGGSAQDTLNSLENIRERYPKEAFYAMMNLVASHDTARVLSSLDGIQDDRNDKEVEKAFPSYDNTSDTAKQKQYLVAFLQMTYAGAPTIYYGDEIGMVGADDPDNRRAMTWGEGNKEIVEWYAKLAKIRSQYTALRTGELNSFTMGDSVLGYVRSDSSDKLIVLMNNTGKELTETIDAGSLIGAKGTKLTELISGTCYAVADDGTVEVKIPAYRGIVLTTNKKKITVDTNALKPAYDSSYKVPNRFAGVTMEQTMTLSETRTIKPILDPIDTADVTGVWKSSDESVVTVKDGVLTPVEEGTAVITVTYGDKTATCKVTVSGMGSVQGFQVSDTTQNTISLKWNALMGAKGYEVYRKNGTVWTKVADVAGTSFTDKNLVWSTSYTYRVRPYHMKGNNKVYGDFTSEITAKTLAIGTPVQVTGLKVKAQSSSKVKLSWNQVKNASGYEVYMKVNNGSYKKVKTITKGSTVYCKFYDLQQGYKYKFKVRALTTTANKTTYGATSEMVSIRMAVVAPSKLNVKQQSKAKAKLNWNKVNGVSGYEITMSTNGGKYKTVATIGKAKTTSVKAYNLKKGKSYVFKIRAYKVVDGKKYYSSTVTSKKLKMK